MSGFMNMHSITSVKYGDVDTSGAMQTTLSTLYGVKEGTGQINFPMQDSNKIYVEETPMPFAEIQGNVSDPNIQLQLLGISLTDLAAISGGTRTAADVSNPEKIEFKSTDSQVFKALQVTGKNDADEDVVWNIPKASLLVGMAETVTKTDMVGVTLMGNILQPTDTNGDIVDPYLYIEVGTATA